MHVWRADKTESLNFWQNFMAGQDFRYPALPAASASSSSPSDNNQDDHGATNQRITKTRAPKITAQVALPTDISLDVLITKYSVTPSVVFQSAFQLYLMRKTGCRDVSFDYLLSGRNIDLANPQLINGNLANFLPFRSKLSSNDQNGGEREKEAKGDDSGDDATATTTTTTTLSSYLETTQSQFWQITEHGTLGLDDVYAAAGLSRASHGNRALFLYQPFEPAPPAPQEDTMKYIVMKGSEVRMYQPYALVVEISRTLSGHLVKVMYDEGYYGEEEARVVAADVVAVVEAMVAAVEGADGDVGVEGFLKGLEK